MEKNRIEQESLAQDSAEYWAMRLKLEELLGKAEECLLLTNMLQSYYDEEEDENA